MEIQQFIHSVSFFLLVSGFSPISFVKSAIMPIHHQHDDHVHICIFTLLLVWCHEGEFFAVYLHSCSNIEDILEKEK